MAESIELKKAHFDNLDLQSLDVIDQKVMKNSKDINKIVVEMVNKMSSDLDALIFEVREAIKTSLTDTTALERFALELSTLLYYIGQSQEYMGLRLDVSKAIYRERYSEEYANAYGTINDKKAVAESNTNYEFIEQSINERAYKRIKIKIENAAELLQTLKKVISRRIAEYELTKVSSAEIASMKYNDIDYNSYDKRSEFKVVGQSNSNNNKRMKINF